MAISCGLKGIRSTLLIFNVIFWLSGCALLILGAWLIVEPGPARLLNAVSTPLMPPALQFPIAYALVSVGGLILIVGFIGCCGALQESRRLITVYFIFLMVVFAVEMTIGILTTVFREYTLVDMETRLISNLHSKYGQEDHEEFSRAIDFFQYKYNCCGVQGNEDYQQSRWLNDTLLQNDKVKNVPATCCVLQTEDVEEAWQNPKPKNEVACQDANVKNFDIARHRQGCYLFIMQEFKFTTIVIIVAGTSFGTFALLVMLFSLLLCTEITDDI